MSRILVVDDDKELRENVLEILEGADFEVSAAFNGEEALEQVQGKNFDLILLDLIMPGMGGMEALPLLRRLCPSTKVILVTAFATVDNAVEAMRKGADDYLTKPFKVNELLMTVMRNLEEAKFQECKIFLDMDSTFNCLSNTIRREILGLFGEQNRMRFMEISRKLGIEDHTKVNFHLKILKGAGLVDQDARKFYILSPQGQKVYECLEILARNLTTRK